MQEGVQKKKVIDTLLHSIGGFILFLIFQKAEQAMHKTKRVTLLFNYKNEEKHRATEK